MNLINRWRALWAPERFHGWGRSRRYFEGWCFKCVSADERAALAFIPGVSYDERGKAHSFVQVMDGHRLTAEYHRFAVQEFRPAADRFYVEVGKNSFSEEHITLALPELTGRLHLHNPTPWPRTLGAPGIMGWYSFVPFMQCSHGVISLLHGLMGQLEYRGERLDFNGGRGYIEKDWGTSFPRAYVWLQTNHFDTADRASLFASVAHIPWLGGYFIGFIAGFWLDGRLFKFATYTGAKKSLQFGDDWVRIEFRDGRYDLRIFARQAAGVKLVSPLSGAMAGHVNESLRATADVELWENGRLIFSGKGRQAGLELAGEVEELIDKL